MTTNFFLRKKRKNFQLWIIITLTKQPPLKRKRERVRVLALFMGILRVSLTDSIVDSTLVKESPHTKKKKKKRKKEEAIIQIKIKGDLLV